MERMPDMALSLAAVNACRAVSPTLVLGPRDLLQVLRIYAPTVAAQVINLKAVNQIPYGMGVYDAMCIVRLPAQAVHAVSPW